MNEMVKRLDKNITYVSHEVQDGRIYIHVKSDIEEAVCPYCGQSSIWKHSRYPKRLQDLPIQGKKVTIIIDTRKFFCRNRDCGRKTFAERFDFSEPNATRTTWLQQEIIGIGLNQSSVSASKHLKRNTCDIGKSTICTLIKKGRRNRQK